MPRLEELWRQYCAAFNRHQEMRTRVCAETQFLPERVKAMKLTKAQADEALFTYFEAYDQDQAERFPEYWKGSDHMQVKTT